MFQLDGVDLDAEDTSSPYTVSWNTATAANGGHTLTARVRDTAGLTSQTASVTVTVANGTSPSVVGQWGASFDIGMVAVNMVLMHTGKVLMFSGDFTQSWTERVWDPATGSMTLRPNPFYNLFCAGQSQLGDGRILVVGGYDPGNFGARNANIFNPVTETWSALPNMAYRRWYPTSTTLPDGRALVTSGAQTCLTCLADVPEIYDPVANTFTSLPTARLGVPYYPFMYVLPDGKIVDAGANENPTETRTLDLTTRTWSMVDPATRDGHTSAMYRPGKDLQIRDSSRQRNCGIGSRHCVRNRHDAAQRHVAAGRVDGVPESVPQLDDPARRQRSHHRWGNDAGWLRREQGRV